MHLKTKKFSTEYNVIATGAFIKRGGRPDRDVNIHVWYLHSISAL